MRGGVGKVSSWKGAVEVGSRQVGRHAVEVRSREGRAHTTVAKLGVAHGAVRRHHKRACHHSVHSISLRDRDKHKNKNKRKKIKAPPIKRGSARETKTRGPRGHQRGPGASATHCSGECVHAPARGAATTARAPTAAAAFGRAATQAREMLRLQTSQTPDDARVRAGGKDGGSVCVWGGSGGGGAGAHAAVDAGTDACALLPWAAQRWRCPRADCRQWVELEADALLGAAGAGGGAGGRPPLVCGRCGTRAAWDEAAEARRMGAARKGAAAGCPELRAQSSSRRAP